MVQPWREVCSIGIYKAGRPWIGYHSVLIRISMILWNSLKMGKSYTIEFYGQRYLKNTPTLFSFWVYCTACSNGIWPTFSFGSVYTFTHTCRYKMARSYTVFEQVFIW